MDSQRAYFVAQQLPLGTRVAQVVGITSASYLAGSYIASSIYACPALLHASPEARAKGWHAMYLVGARSIPFIATSGSLAFGYLAAKSYGARVIFTLYAISTISTLSVIPYTLTLMKSVNSALEAKAMSSTSSAGPSSLEAAEKGTGAEGETRELLAQWSRFNLGRAVLQGVSTLLGLWAIVSRPETIAVVVQESSTVN